MSDIISLDNNTNNSSSSSAKTNTLKDENKVTLTSDSSKKDESKTNEIKIDAAPQPDIFSQPKSQVKEDSKIVSSILTTKEPTKAKPILGNAAALQKSIREEQQDRLRRKLRNRKTVFAFAFIAVLGVFGYFTMQFTPSDFFPRNKTAELAELNAKVRSTQTQYNKYRYLIGQLHLNSFSYLSDTFFDKTDQLNRGSLDDQALHGAAAEVSQFTLDLPETISKVRDAITPEVVVKTYQSDAESVLSDEELKLQFENDLRAALNEEKALLGNDASSDEVKIINNTLKLVGNNKLIDTLKQTSIDNLKKDFTSYASQLDDAQRDKLQQVTSSFLTTTISDIAVIRTLKSNRIAWSKILREIDILTVSVDPTFGKGLFETLQEGIIYTGYEFESSTNKIVLSGITKTSDARNFRLMSDLIDTLASSPMFENVEMRSFTKSGSVDEGFTAHFKIDLTLSKDNLDVKNILTTPAPAPVARKRVDETVAVVPPDENLEALEAEAPEGDTPEPATSEESESVEPTEALESTESLETTEPALSNEEPTSDGKTPPTL